MAQEENGIPVGDDNVERRSINFLPRYFRTTANAKFIGSTLDQMLQPGVVEKVDGYVGRKDSKAFVSTDNYVKDVSNTRQSYQLEPAAVVEDNVGNVIMYKDYMDYMNSTAIRNAKTIDHSITNAQEYYAWDPHINWDKFVNFREYYWLPQGPNPIAVYGNFREVESTITVNAIDNVDNFGYNFNPINPNSNTTLTLFRGQTYVFDINTPNMPFTIRTAKNLDASSIYSTGVSSQKVDSGQITFEVDLEAPDYLYYVNENDIEASGLIIIKDILDNTVINVEQEILNKKAYTMANGYNLSNGMKLKFYGDVSPAKYANGNWYVEGVGDSITLVSEADVVLTADYLIDNAIEFDGGGFSNLPFDNATSYANQKDYICINKASPDKNQWSRYNRWTHKSVIEQTAKINNVAVELDQNFRAVRPIIEFEAGLKLYNCGSFAKQAVDLVDTVTKDVFSTIEGQAGYFVDQTELVSGMRVLFTADPDSFVAGKIYEVKFITQNGNRQITLVETDDTAPQENETVFVTSGAKFKGKLFWYNGTKWNQAQDKIKLNQAPLFDLYNGDDNSLSDLDGSSFVGNKIFSYKEGNGSNDTELAFPLSYRTIENSGDIVFDFNMLADTYTYDDIANVITASTDIGYLRKYTSRTSYASLSAWTKADKKSEQWVVGQPTVGPRTNNFSISWYNKSGNLSDLEVRVYVNNVRIKDFSIVRNNGTAYVQFTENLQTGSKLVIKTKSKAEKNANGFYEFPINLEKNPQNENVTSFTLGEVLDHVSSIVDNVNEFEGTYPGSSNLRDIGNLSKNGLRFVKHSGPINLALFNLTQKDYDAIKAIKYAGIEYLKFKREFVRLAGELGFDGPTKLHVDKVLGAVNDGKTSKDAFYFSDMVPVGGDKATTHVIDDASETIFSLTRGIDFTKLNQFAVLPYLNGKVLTKDLDYTVSTNGFLELKIDVKAGDELVVYEYETTDGCWIPPTPTKLGLYPKYRPEVFLDDTYISVTPESDGPYKIYGRDETTTNTSYKNKLGWFYPLYTTEASAKAADLANGGSGQAHDHLFAGYNKLFYMPSSMMNHAVADDDLYQEWPVAKPMIQGHDGSLWRCFGDYRDELILDLERRIFNNLKQPYREDVLDVADFTSTKSRKTDFDRYKISNTMISDFNRWLETVGNPDYTTNTYFDRTDGFTFNYSSFGYVDETPLPGFWRAVFKDIYNTDRPHSHPWEVLGLTIKPSWWDEVYGEAPYTSNNLLLWEDLSKGIVREPGKKVVYRNKFANENMYEKIPVDDQGYLLNPANAGVANFGLDSSYNDPFVFGDEGPVETAWRRSSHYPFSLITARALYEPAQFFGVAFDISRIARDNAGQLVYTETSKQIELDKIKFPNGASDNSRVNTAGIVNYIQGYLNDNATVRFKQYQTELASVNNKICAKIGGFTQKEKFRLILDSRNPTNEGNVFVPIENYKIHLNKSVPLEVYSYSGVIVEITGAGFIVKGYDRETPVFKTYPVMPKVSDPLITIGGTSETFLTWTSGKFYEVGQIVELNDDYYRVKISHTSADGFDLDNFQKIAELPIEGGAQAYLRKNFDRSAIKEVQYGTLFREIQDVVDFLLGYEQYLISVGFKFETFNKDLGEIENWLLSAKEFMFWTTQNWEAGTLISLSPSAREIRFSKEYTVVDDIYDNFYDYSLLGTDGKRLLADFATTERTNTNDFGLYVKNTDNGIFNLKIPVVQHEHVVILDNVTVFNDIIYNRPQGYRQERIKVKGYRSDDWNGSYNIPGFIFDDAKSVEWTPYQDYAIGALVKHKQYYYVANNNVTGTESFPANQFVQLSQKPEQQLLPNWDYKAKQFLDFYDLDSDNFDIEQQKLAQHTFGYQNRTYLENIINDDISQFKFFQGAIQDKGTKNVLTKLFDKLGSASKESLEFFEEWAVRVGRYGATTGDDQFEILLDEEKFRLSPQPIELVESVDPRDTSLINRLTRNDVYVKSNDYNHKPLPTKYFNEDNSFTKTAGYVNTADVNLSLLNYNDILEQDLSDVPTNSYTWVATQKNQRTWGVYKHINENVRIKSIESANGSTFKIILNSAPDFETGDIIGVNSVSETIDGFYKVKSISLNTVTLETDDNFEAVEDPDGFVSILQNVRVDRTRDVNTIIRNKKQFNLGGSDLINDIVWIDDDDTGKWLVLKNKQVYELKNDIINKLAGLLDSTQKDFGQSFDISKDNNTLVVSAPKDLNGSVYVYNRPSDNTDFGYSQTINEFSSIFESNGGFGTSVAISPDKKYLAIGSPYASNLKSRYKGDYSNTLPYVSGDIVLHDAQLWKAKRAVDGDSIVDFESHASNQQSISNDYDSFTNSYPTIPFMVRGDYVLGEDEATDHILIRAKTDQFEGAKAGDRLFLKWNKYTTSTQTGINPFDNDTILTEDFINGEHTISAKVEAVLFIESTLYTPAVNSEVVTDTGKATVLYTKLNAENQMNVYLGSINGTIGSEGTLKQNDIVIGDFVRNLQIADDYHAGWFKVDVGQTFNSTNLVEENPNLVVKTIKLENDVTTPTPEFTNILDVIQSRDITKPTRPSYFGVLSNVEGQTLINQIDSRWWFRTARSHGDSMSIGDTFRFWLSDIYNNGIRQEPTAVNLTFDYLNNQEHTVDDIWDGFVDVRLTNFDLQGDPFIPTVGNILTCVTSGESAEVAYIDRDFASARIFLKNKTGDFALGGDFGESSNATFVENDSTVRTIGPIDRAELQNNISGPILVVDKEENIAIPNTNALADLEYWQYSVSEIQGVFQTTTAPSSVNLDWNRVYNIPLSAEGTAGAYDNAGTFAVYERKGVAYQLINFFTVPDAREDHYLGNQIRFVQYSADSYRLFVHAKGDNTEINQGRIYYFDKNTSEDWSIGTDVDYRGLFRVTGTYFEGETVKFGQAVYKAKTNLIPGVWNQNNWELVTGGLDILGFVPNDTSFSIDESVAEQDQLEEFGTVFDLSSDGGVLIATAKYTNHDDSSIPNTKIVVYRKVNNQYAYSQTIEGSNLQERFGEDIAISNDGKKIAVGASYNGDIASDNGAVYIYIQSGERFVYNQTIYPTEKTPNVRFGAKLDFDGNTLAITAKGGDIEKTTTFDKGVTSFDNSNTKFTQVDNNSGLVSIYETVNNTLVYGQDFAYDRDTEDFGSIVKISNNHVYVGLPKQSVTINNAVDKGVVSEFRKPFGKTSWDFARQPVDSVDTSKFKGVFLYNTKTNKLITYIDYIDPIQGKIAGPAEQEIDFKTSYDPARYSTSTNSNITANELDYTSKEWIGKIWWDVDSAKFIDFQQGDIIESTSNFNKLYPGTEVDVHEWVETTLLPSEWDAQSGSEDGLTRGISGTSKYGDSVYSTRRVYNSATGTFTTYYYYWVKGKRTLPELENRKITAFDVARYISDPDSLGHRFVAMLGNDRFSIYNCESLVKGKEVGLSFNWWTIENKEQNIHNQYQLISDGLETSIPNSVIEQKWIDSLVGFDLNDRPVPDINLPIKQRYGNLNEPRQSWFVNRTEARKQFVERTNKVLQQNLIVDDVDISPLNAFDPQPTSISGLFDTTSDTYAEIGFVSVARVKPATLALEIENGVVINVLITDAGEGYINSPTYKIKDTKGSGADLDFELDANGKISKVNIINGGKNYSSNASIEVRKFSVLVKADETIGGKWAVYEYTNSTYSRILTQSFDVRPYWAYRDWYEIGYSQFTQIDHAIDGAYQLYGLDDSVGEVVKISSVGTGGWLLLEKIDTVDTTDYSVNYKTIGRENGTIQFSNSLYDVTADNVAFDGANYDRIFFDTEPVEEMRRVINYVKNNLFVNKYRKNWNELFFASLRYVFKEQPNVDWAFKTSFIKAKHNVGELAQKITFKNDSLPSYEAYVEEMKPYKTKIREYLSSYEKVDNASTTVTDFDLPPIYNVVDGRIVPQTAQIVGNEIVAGTADLSKYPAKHWADNVGYQITQLSIADAGSGYTTAPIIKITGGGGTGAKATAFVGNGKITSVQVTDTGSGYISQPTIEIIGSVDEGGSPARLSAIFGQGKARASTIRCKFDRVTNTFLFQQLSQTETFTSVTDQLYIDLKWPMELKSTNINVTIDGLESLRSEYTFSNIEDTSKGYTRYYGRITFTNALSSGKNVVIKYNKAPDLLQAQDRINLYYDPATGMYGNDLSQLLDGIDYGGVEVTSFDFGSGSGFDSDAWFTTTYDTFDTTYEDEVFQLDGSTEVFQLSKPLEDGIEYHVYLNGKRIDDPNFGAEDSSLVTNDNAVIRSLTGDGEQTTVTITNDIQRFRDGDIVVIRKKSSDGSIIPDPRSYDTMLSGGDLQFSTAKGINPEEIVIDGDGFVTPTTSKGPEEQVPGQILDAVDIRVFHRTENGGSLISSNNYDADGTRTKFKFGIQPQSKSGLFVTVDRVLYSQSSYNVDYKNKEVEFDTAPSVNSRVNIVSISGNGENILEQKEITGDGCTTNFETKAIYNSKLDYIATVNGEIVESVLVSSSDESTADGNYAVISFGTAPADNSVINYVVYSKVNSFSKIETQEFTGDGSTVDFTLSKEPYSAKPNSHNVIVKVDNKILNPGYNQQFDIKSSQREYYLEIWQSPIGSFEASDILVLINGVEKEVAVDYNIVPANSSIILNAGIGSDGDILEVYLRTDGEYAFGEVEIVDGNKVWTDSDEVLKFTTAPALGSKITVYTFNKHDFMDFERIQYDVVARTTLVAGSEDDIQYKQLQSGLIKLRYPAIDDQYCWLTVNGILQTPSVDYVLTADKKYLRFKESFDANDAIEVIQFSATGEILPQFGFSQFKDILNRNIYKRLGHTAPLKLAVDLKNTDKEIFVEDASTLSAPDKNSKIPGIIFINGERIEYLIKEGNRLRQIQRATLGTGAPEVHLAGSDIYNADITQTAPYGDKTSVEEFTGDNSTTVFELGFTAESVNQFEVFVAGKRLRKNAIQVFDVNKDQDSPEADVTSPAEFTVSTLDNKTYLTLTNTPPSNANIKVVRKTGTIWTEVGETLKDSKSLVARFFKAEKVELPK